MTKKIQAKDNQLSLGELSNRGKALSAEQRVARYMMLPWTRHNVLQQAIVEQTVQNPQFLEACEKAGIKVSRRQASKWRRKKGKAWTSRESSS